METRCRERERGPGRVQVAPPGRKAGGGRRRADRVKKSSLCKNQKRSLCLEGSLSEAGTPPPHNLDTAHGPVARKTTTKQKHTEKIVQGDRPLLIESKNPTGSDFSQVVIELNIRR